MYENASREGKREKAYVAGRYSGKYAVRLNRLLLSHVDVIHNGGDEEEHAKAKEDVALRPPREHEGAARMDILIPELMPNSRLTDCLAVSNVSIKIRIGLRRGNMKQNSRTKRAATCRG